MFKRPKINSVNSPIVQEFNKKITPRHNSISVDRRLRESRSMNYLNAITKIDTGNRKITQIEKELLMDAIKSEFPDIPLPHILIGIVAKCYLGKPYEVHVLDIQLDILKHYKEGEVLPNGLEKARNIANSPYYEFIEVYFDCMRAISKDGNVSIIKE